MLHKLKCAKRMCHNNSQPVSASILFWKQTDSLRRKRSSEAPLLDREGHFSSSHDLNPRRLLRFLSRMVPPLMKSQCLNLAFKNRRLFSFRPKKTWHSNMDHHFQRPNPRHRHFRSHHCWKKSPPVWSPGDAKVRVNRKKGRRDVRRMDPIPLLFLTWFLPCSMFYFAGARRKMNADLVRIHGRKVKWRIARLLQKRKEQMASKAVKESKEADRPLLGGKLGGVGSPKLWRRWGSDGVAEDEGFRPSMMSCEAWGETTTSVTSRPGPTSTKCCC